MGMLPANEAMVAKKSPKSTKMPYSSTKKPVNGQRRRMRRIPAANAAVPLSFWRRAKKIKVFCKPMMRVRPMRKRIYCVVRGLSIGVHIQDELTFPIANLDAISQSHQERGQILTWSDQRTSELRQTRITPLVQSASGPCNDGRVCSYHLNKMPPQSLDQISE